MSKQRISEWKKTIIREWLIKPKKKMNKWKLEQRRMNK